MWGRGWRSTHSYRVHAATITGPLKHTGHTIGEYGKLLSSGGAGSMEHQLMQQGVLQIVGWGKGMQPTPFLQGLLGSKLSFILISDHHPVGTEGRAGCPRGMLGFSCQVVHPMLSGCQVIGAFFKKWSMILFKILSTEQGVNKPNQNIKCVYLTKGNPVGSINWIHPKALNQQMYLSFF